MKRITKIFLWLVSLLVVGSVLLVVAAYLTPKSNRVPTWRINLEEIDTAKILWAGNGVNTTNDTPTWEDLRPYVSDWAPNHIAWTNGMLVDPDGGIYTIGRIGEEASCLLNGKKLHL